MHIFTVKRNTAMIFFRVVVFIVLFVVYNSEVYAQQYKNISPAINEKRKTNGTALLFSEKGINIYIKYSNKKVAGFRAIGTGDMDYEIRYDSSLGVDVTCHICIYDHNGMPINCYEIDCKDKPKRPEKNFQVKM